MSEPRVLAVQLVQCQGVDTSVRNQGSEPISCNMGTQMNIIPHQTAAEVRQT
jgi:hypothetical protein